MWWFFHLARAWYPPHPKESSSQKKPDSYSPDYYFRSDADCHYAYFPLTAVFDPNEYWYTFKLKNSATGDVMNSSFSLYYRPFHPVSCPKEGAFCNYTGVADGWGCWDEYGEELCFPIGNHSAYNYTLPSWNSQVISVGTLKRSPAIYTVPGYKNYKMEMWIDCKMDQKETFQNQMAVYENKTFCFFWESNWSCGVNGKEVPDAEAPNSGYRLTEMPSYSFFQQSDDTYVNYSMSNFEPVNGLSVSAIVLGMTEEITLYMNFQKVIPCPDGYTCAGDNATIWKCWTTLDRRAKKCFPVADITYGFSLHSKSMLLLGGWDDYQTFVELICDEECEDPNKLEITSVADTISTDLHELRFRAASSAFCPRKIEPEEYLREPSLGGYIVVVWWTVVAILVGGCTVFNYMRSGLLLFPFAMFWKDVGECIVAGWNTVTMMVSVPERDEIPSKAQSVLSVKYVPV